MRKFSVFLLPLAILCASAAGQNAATAKALILKSDKKGAWEASARLLTLGSQTPLCRLAESQTKRAETAVFKQFLKDAADSVREAKKMGGQPKLYFSSELKLKANHARLLSFLCSEENYYGGAHGMTHSRTYNFGFVGGSPKRFGLWDALKSDAASKNDFRMILIGKAMKLKGADWVDEGEVNDFTNDQYERFWIDGTTLVFEFDPYELGSYAAGPMTIRVPLREIRGLVRKDGPLAFLQVR